MVWRPWIFSCECCLLVFCGFRSETVEEFLKLVFHCTAWPDSMLSPCPTVSPWLFTASLLWSRPSHTFVFCSWATATMGWPCSALPLCSGDPSVPSKIWEESRALCAVQQWFVSVNPQKGVIKSWVEVPVQGCWPFTVAWSPTGLRPALTEKAACAV